MKTADRGCNTAKQRANANGFDSRPVHNAIMQITIQSQNSMENEVIVVSQTDMLTAQNRAEIDVQIATAKQYPRDIQAALNRIKTIATLDSETAEDCFYALRRQGSLIEGVTVRLAEIIAGSWGNLRVQTRIVGNDGKTVTAQGVCLDLETNLGVSVDVKRRITDKNGKTYSEDMQVTTGNAASAIAFRNAVLKVVPKAVTKRIINEIKDVALGKSMDLESRRQNMLAYFAKIGVSEKEILTYCKVKNIADIDAAMIFELSGLKNAIKEGTTSVQESFRANVADVDAQAEAARLKAEENKQKVEAAMAASVQK